MRQIDQPNSANRHSRLGIASTIIGGGLPLLVIFLAILFITILEFNTKNYNSKIHFGRKLGETLSYIFFTVSLLSPLVHLMGLILGLIGVFSKQNKKLFAIIGIILNSFFVLFSILAVGLMIYGLMSIPFR